MTDAPDRQFELRGFDGKIAHLVSMRVSANPAPYVFRWRGRSFVQHQTAFYEAVTTTLDDDDGVFAPVKRAPTLADVDAELQPKGLQVLTLTEPMWVRPWTCDDEPDCWERTMLKPHRSMPYTHNASVLRTIDGKWRYDAGHDRHGNPITKLGLETLGAAQAACEAAIVAAWRSR